MREVLRFFDHIVGSVTKKHLGVLWGIVDPVIKVEFFFLFHFEDIIF